MALFRFFVLLVLLAAAGKNGRRGNRGFSRSSVQTDTPELRFDPGQFGSTVDDAALPANDEQSDMLIGEIGRVRSLLEEAGAEDGRPNSINEVACQTGASGLLGLQLAQLHDLEIGTSAASSWEAPAVADAGVLSALSVDQLREHLETLQMGCNDRSA